MRRDENLESMRLRGLEDTLHVLNSIVFLKTFADQGPRDSFFTQDLVLRIDEYNCLPDGFSWLSPVRVFRRATTP